jgi:acetolactate synthase-1/2/3 large subunit
MSTESVTTAIASPSTGATRWLDSLAALGVEALFCNPGTTELAIAEALVGRSAPRGILVAQELVATGAADAYGRLHGLGAALLHLGPGFANGAAFVHNAKRAGTPVLVGVGEHPRSHQGFDVGLTMPLEEVLCPFCVEVLRIEGPEEIVPLTLRAGERALVLRGPVGLILPSDVMEAVVDAPSPAPARAMASRSAGGGPILEDLGPHPLLLLGSDALGRDEQRLAVRLAEALGASLRTETFPAVMARGGGLRPIPRLPYLPSQARAVLAEASSVVLVGAEEPIAYFHPPAGGSRLVPEGIPVKVLSRPWDGAREALGALAKLPASDAATGGGLLQGEEEPLGAANLGAVLATWIEGGDIIIDEARSSSQALAGPLAHAAGHTVLGHPGGAIGGGISLALGAALGAGRRVLALVADGGSLYAPQALWSIARERLPVLVVVLDNGGYEILRTEMAERGLGGDDLTRLPGISYAGLMASFGVPSKEVATVGELRRALAACDALPCGIVVRMP